MVRTYARLLQARRRLDAPRRGKGPVLDAASGYFNSLRVLGGARMQVQDDVVDRIEAARRRGDARSTRRRDRIELTSRERVRRDPAAPRAHGRAPPDEDALDVVLATNMISVGVDVDRLGLMVVMGQPQTTAEYIQATSRVGRQHPGLVVVVFNAARSRDRSHYETFAAYHAALYRQVESTSVTPFSSRARDRGLHAVLVALARSRSPAAAPTTAARRGRRTTSTSSRC